MLIFLIIKWFTFESSLQYHYSMSKIESKISPKRDAEKNYEAVEMLKTENVDYGMDSEKGSNKHSEDQITLRRDSPKNCENYKKSCSKITFLSPMIGLRLLNFLVISPI